MFSFAEEASSPASLQKSGDAGHWRCLIVDDDEGVHQALGFAMHKLPVEGACIEWLHAYSAAEAVELLRRERDIAVIVLDVVMEHDQAGLDLVRVIRHELGLTDVRIILHTGQPGFAPEIAAIRDYEINDYRTKSELTRNHLYTCLAVAIRAYRQIRAIGTARSQLRDIVRRGASLMASRDEASFARHGVEQLVALLGMENYPGALALRGATGGLTGIEVVWASGTLAGLEGLELFALKDGLVRNCCRNALECAGLVRSEQGAALCITARDGQVLVLYVAGKAAAGWLADDSVLETFSAHFAACFDNRELLGRLQHDAYFDRLLGLPNRRCLGEAIEKAIHGGHSGMVLALVDIDGFGEINEALGQPFGDAVLHSCAARLRSSLSSAAMIARLSADVFAILGSERELMPERFPLLFVEPLHIEGGEMPVSVKIGVTRIDDVPQPDAAMALEAAFHTLRVAKAGQGGPLAWYSPELSRQTQTHLGLLQGLRQALRESVLHVEYQPQVSLPSRQLIGLEALVRWQRPDGVRVPPDRFIPVAEQSGLIREIGLFVLADACAVLAQLQAQGWSELRMAVNVSALQFKHPAFLAEVSEVIAAAGISPERLEFEITESVAMEDDASVREALAALAAMGVQLAIDDFGTGYSSLAQLKRLSVDRLKIDRAFVRDLGEEGPDASIAGFVIQLSRQLGKEVIAEGVETEAQAELLERLGCDQAQGFLFARPMPAAQLQEWLRADSARRA